ncbi:hypothetical protein CL634_11430 [bacterium]|nr:hypothetical protein [bacterium]
MASLLTQSDKDSFRDSIIDLFDTFSRDIVIHKEPKIKISEVNPSSPILPGYGGGSNIQNEEYIAESKTFKAMIRYSSKQGVEVDSFVGAKIPVGMVSIKVQEDGKNYINEGQTEKVVLDNKSFKLTSNDSVKDHFGYKLYVYFIEEIK